MLEAIGIILTSIASIAGSYALVVKYKSAKDTELENLKMKNFDKSVQLVESNLKNLEYQVSTVVAKMETSKEEISKINRTFMKTKETMDVLIISIRDYVVDRSGRLELIEETLQRASIKKIGVNTVLIHKSHEVLEVDKNNGNKKSK